MTAINRISGSLSTFFSMILRPTKKKADHKKLSRHIADLNQKISSEEIIRQSASCLKEVINYTLFAFTIKKEDRTDIWFDPRICRKPLEDKIIQDLNLTDQRHLNYLNVTSVPDAHDREFDLGKLISYETRLENSHARIYIIPGKTMYSHLDEITDLVFQSCTFALSRQMKIENLSNAARIDALTGCYNRGEFENQVKRNIAGALRHKNDLSIFMFDLDHFKRVNDRFGHLAGDEVLKKISMIVQNDMREGDIFARYGGEEFIAILPETGRKKAMELAERLRIKILKSVTHYKGKKIKVTASFGVSQLDHNNVDSKKIIKDADDMLYKAKIMGRNIVMPGLMKVVVSRTVHSRTKQAGMV